MSRKVAGLRKTVAKEAKVEDELFWNTLPKPNLHPLFEPTDPPEVKGFKEDRRRSQGFGDGEGPEVLDVKARSRRKTFVLPWSSSLSLQRALEGALSTTGPSQAVVTDLGTCLLQQA